MAVEDIKSDLQSLIKLYGHLQSLKIGPQSASSEYLDEKAQLFLKDLLDGASERVFGAHSEILASRLDVSEATPVTHPESLIALPMSRSSVPSQVLETSPRVEQTLSCNSVIADDQKLKPETLVFTSGNSNPKPRKRRRSCRTERKICIELYKSRDTKDLNLHYQQWGEPNPYQWNEKQQQKITLDDSVGISGNAVARSEAESGIGRDIEKKTQEVESMSTPVAPCAVKYADTGQTQNLLSGIHDMQSKSVNGSVWNFKDMARVPQYDSVNRSIEGNEVVDHKTMKPTEFISTGNITKLSDNVENTSSSCANNFKENQMGNSEFKEPFKIGWIENQVGRRSVKAMVQRIESLSRLSSKNGDQTSRHGCRYVRGMRVSACPNDVAIATPASPCQTEKEFQDRFLSPKAELNFATSRSSISNRTTHHRKMVSPVLYGNSFDQVEGKARENRSSMANQIKILPCRLDVENTSSSSVASSCRTTPQESTDGSYSEEYSESDIQSDNYVGSTSCPDSDTSGYENSNTNSRDSGFDLSEDIDQNNVGRDGDSESISISSVRNRRSGIPTMMKKQTGKLKKMKDKLGLIFHHHHHHHHHHHDKKTKATRGRSLWKNAAGKIFHGKGRTEKYKGKGVEKDTSSLVGKVVNKNQKRHFHDLVKGTWKHVKTSRSSKVSKNDIEKVGKIHHGGKKKGAQKLQWWRMLQQQRKAAKMPSKPKVKVGVGTSKPRLRPLPMLTSEDGEG